MKDLYLIGGGGHCKSCIDVIEQEGKFKIKGIFDKKESVGKDVLGYPIIGSDDDLSQYVSAQAYFLITVGQIKSPDLRISLFLKLKKENANIAIIVSPRAYVSKHASIGEGTILLHDVLVNAAASIGSNCIINTKALIEHDALIESHCHISTATVVNGNCRIEEGSFVGSNSVLKEGLVISKRSVVPAGSFYRG